MISISARRSNGCGARWTSSRSDDANLMALEGVMVGLLVLGAMLFVADFQIGHSTAPRTHDSLSKTASDSLDVLTGLPADEDAYGRNELSKLVVESLYGQTSNLTLKLDGFFPKGTRYNVYLDNGAATRQLYVGGTPGGERVSAARAFQPSWGLAFVQPDFSTYDGATMKMNATAVAIAKGNAIVYGTAYRFPHLVFPNGWRLTLMNGTGVPSLNDSYVKADALSGYPTLGATFVSANASWTFKGSVLRGASPYAVVSDAYLGTSYAAARNGLNASTARVTAWNSATQTFDATRTTRLGHNFTVTWDLTPYINAHAGHFAAGSSNTTAIRVIAPVPMLNTTTGLYFAEWSTKLSGIKGSATFNVPRSALLGPHVVVVEVNSTLAGSSGSVSQSARLVERLDVAFEDGTPPVDPMYRVVVEAWEPEWE